MKTVKFGCLSLLSLAACLSIGNAEDWTRFRGPRGSGISKTESVPIAWNGDKNMKWSVELPGRGSSCPIVYQDRVYLTCYTGYGLDPRIPGNPSKLKRHLICFSREDGREIWRSTVDSDHDEDPYKGFITDHGYASSTPVTDGKQLFVHFGKTGVFAFDIDGRQVWKKNVGTRSDPARWGNGASCILYQDMVILNAGNTDNALIALKKSDGSQVWKVTDEKFTNTWSTPIVVKVDDHDELIINMPGSILAYNPENGQEIWRADSPIDKTVCGSAVYDNGVVYAMGGREGRAIAVRAGGRGDVSDTHTVWTRPLRSGIGTPLVANGNLYWTATGIAFCASCETGEYVYRERLKTDANANGRRRPAGDYASPVLIGDHILMLTRSGATHIIQASNEFKQVAENSFPGDDSRFNSTPAISDGQIFVRSEKMLYCISE